MDSRQEERAEEKKQWKVEVLCMRIKNMPKKSVVKKAFIKSIPILCSYHISNLSWRKKDAKTSDGTGKSITSGNYGSVNRILYERCGE